jgi:Glycosyl hydrolase family 26
VSRHARPRSRRTPALWIAVNATVLTALTLWLVSTVFMSSPTSSSRSAPGPNLGPNTAQAIAVGSSTTGSASAPPTPPPVPSKAVFLTPPAPYFGLSTPQAPWSRSELNAISAKAGAHPTLIEFFVTWTQEFRPDAVSMCYSQHALPLLSWEPWAGLKSGPNQPAFALRRIISGAYDAYITRFAQAIRAQRWPVALRFAHEMNGNWYPWSESQSGNRPGEYVQAWRHVHDIFTRVGATNVIWVWSPNIIRPVPQINLTDLYPGDSYVDWVGMVGYDAQELTAGQVFDPTIARIRMFTHKPLLITETGTGPSAWKAAWTTSLFTWLRKHRDVVGFTWFELSRAQGGNKDWRFSADPRTQQAFHDGIVESNLAPPIPYG